MNRHAMSWRTWVLLVLLALVAAACGAREETTSDAADTSAAEEEVEGVGGAEGAGGSDASGSETASGSEEQVASLDGTELALAVNPWTGSAVDANVAKVVLEDELDASVELVDIDENAQWAGLAEGDLDAVLEVWPSGHQDNIATYIDDQGSVLDVGDLGAVGRIGWWIPSYLLSETPELATSEGLAENAELFATAETGDQGQFLAGDPSFVSFDAEIIENLGLPFEVVQSGSEAALLTELETAYQREEPLLMYFYTPHWAHAEYDLTQVELPEYTEECGAKPEAERDCGYPEDVLMKVASAGLEEKSPEALEFFTRFELTNDQQNEVALMIDQEGMDPAAAAEQWVQDNPDVIQEWLPRA